VIGKTGRRLLGVSLLAIVTGCSQTDKTTDLGVSSGQQAASQQPAVIQGACPQVYLREGTAVHRAYAKGAKDDPQKLAASDGENTLYSNLNKFGVTIPAEGTAQFVFTEADIVIPGGAGSYAKIYVGFDEGPYDTK
jgi:hypothetical protein